jgi:transposase
MRQALGKGSLDTLKVKKIEKLRKEAKEVRIHQRRSALLWLNQGYSPEQVAELLGVCTRTVDNWVELYHQGDLQALCALHYKGDPG